MPGVRDRTPNSPDWFEQEFGFHEAQDAGGGRSPSTGLPLARRRRLFTNTRSRFRYAEGALYCRDSDASFLVGHFELVSVKALYLRAMRTQKERSMRSLGKLTFRHLLASTRDLHLDPANAGAVFQAHSLFNCLETPLGILPEDGVTRYAREATQGTACAIACPAATVFRNYFEGGTGQSDKCQLDCLAGVAQVVHNEVEGYWKMESGHCLPQDIQSIGRLGRRLRADDTLQQKVQDHLQVGVHWEAEVSGGSHRVVQVLCSALPVGLVKKVRASDWEPFAVPLLKAAYDATLLVATALAAERGARVCVYLTVLGAGSLGNRRAWILGAIEQALTVHRDEPLDVFLVHSSSLPQDLAWQQLEYGREPHALKAVGKGDAFKLDASMHRRLDLLQEEVNAKGPVSVDGLDAHWGRLDHNCDGVVDIDEVGALMAWRSSNAGKCVNAFASLDVNGDGVIDRSELTIVLQCVDEQFFTNGIIEILLEEADANGDGEIHYLEFCSWLYGEDPVLMNRMLSVSNMFEAT